MPQMSPFFWVLLMVLFILLYVLMGVMVYFKFCPEGVSAPLGAGIKFLVVIN